MLVLGDGVPLPSRSWVVTIGNFDGVHLGHAYVLSKTVEIAKRIGSPAMVLTLDPHPALVFGHKKSVLLCEEQDKIACLSALGIDCLLKLSFNDSMMRMTPEDFVGTMLHDYIGARHVVVGRGFVFGYRRSGNGDMLCDLCSALGIEVSLLNILDFDSCKYSSTDARNALRIGNFERYKAIVGRDYTVRATIVEHLLGEGMILSVPEVLILPEGGHYAVMIDDTQCACQVRDSSLIITGYQPNLQRDFLIKFIGKLTLNPPAKNGKGEVDHALNI